MTKKELLAAYKRCAKNFMTPTVLAKRVLPSVNTVVELSEGTGFRNDPIYSVTVLVFDNEGQRKMPVPDVSQMFRDLETARDHYLHCLDKPEKP